MNLGASKVKITPPIGVDLTGFVARMAPSAEVLDDLFARAVYLKTDKAAWGLVTLDLLAISHDSVSRIRKSLESKGISGGSVAFCASHTHSGPAAVRLRECGEISQEYLNYLEEQIVEAVTGAYNSCNYQCKTEYAEVKVTGISHNRRDSKGPNESILRLLRFSDGDAASNPTVYLVNFPCHGVCLCETCISGDYISTLCRRLEESSPKGSVALFINGPSGDINPIERGMDGKEKIGNSLADTVLSLKDPTLWASLDDTLGVSSVTLSLPFGPLPTHAQLADEARRHLEGLKSPDPMGRKVSRAMAEWALDVSRRLDKNAAQTSEVAEVMAFKLGSLRIVTLPGEIFTVIGQRIRAELDGHPVMIAAHSNGSVGYVPGVDDYSKGGYELDAYKWYDYPSVLAPEAGEMLIKAALDLAKS